jgi:hypothetical protein
MQSKTTDDYHHVNILKGWHKKKSHKPGVWISQQQGVVNVEGL